MLRRLPGFECTIQPFRGQNVGIVSVDNDRGIFILPLIDLYYMADHPFSEWKERWELQRKENSQCNLSATKLKSIIISLMDIPERDDFVLSAMNSSFDDFLNSVEKSWDSQKAQFLIKRGFIFDNGQQIDLHPPHGYTPSVAAPADGAPAPGAPAAPAAPPPPPCK